MTARTRPAAALTVVAAAALAAACSGSDPAADATEQIHVVTAQYYDGLADGDLDAVRAAVCAAERDNMDADVLLGAEESVRNEVVEVRDVRIEGDSAQAVVELARDEPGGASRTYTMSYRDEDGWRLC